MEFVSIRFFVYICIVKLIYMDDKDFNIEFGVLTKYKGNESHVVIPKGVTEIATWAFFHCDNVTSIVIPSRVNVIGNSAFTGCKNLTSIDISDNVTWIEKFAFSGCTNLASIKIPSSITEIGCGAFEGIKKVKPQYKENGALRAFKAFNKNWTCKYYFQYEVGKSYHQNGKIICCSNGFHACTNPLNVFGYYYGNLNSLRFAEVELSGEMHKYCDKVAASDINIVRELTVQDLCEIYNSMEKEIYK